MKTHLKKLLLLLFCVVSLKTHSQIIVDSFDIDYPECTNCLLPEQEGPAMTITVKHYRLANLPASGNAAVIFVPGGGFIVINPQGLIDPEDDQNGLSPHNINVAEHLALDSVHVWSVSYTISNSLDLTKMVTGEDCGMATQFSKGDFEFASLKAFWSFRKLLSEFKTDSFPSYGIDTNKVFLVGHSAGAILSIYSAFLGANDIPTNLMSKSTFIHFGTRKKIPLGYITQYFPVMRFKGIMAMSGGSLYTNIFDDNTELFGSDGMAIYLLHGTCDEMLHPDVERLPARCPNRPTLPYFDTHRMNWTASSSNNTRYPIGYGSSWIFKKLWADSAKVLYEQVCEGGHDILQYSMRGSWNYEGFVPPNDPRNNYNPVFLRIEDFVLKTLGKRSPGFIKGLTGFVPDSTNAKCTNESDPLKTDTTWAITADSITYGWEGTCANRYLYAQKKGRETIVYRWRFYQGNTPVTGWLPTIEPKLNVNFVPVNSTYTVKLQTQNGCGLGGIQSKNISFTPFSCRMAGAVDEEIPNSITNALSEPDNIDGEWVRIVDMGGRIILEGKFPLESDWQQVFIYELDVPSGIYIVQQLRENNIMNTKIFKP